MKRFIWVALIVHSISVSYAQSVWDAKTENLSKDNSDIVVYRSPTCGCCGKWLAHLNAHGFNVTDNIVDDVQGIKEQYGVTSSLASCHTAIINGYVIEGHVPAGDIKTMLKNKDNIKGLAVPGMVAGTPGMEMGDRRSPFKVIAFDASGQLKVYKNYSKY